MKKTCKKTVRHLMVVVVIGLIMSCFAGCSNSEEGGSKYPEILETVVEYDFAFHLDEYEFLSSDEEQYIRERFPRFESYVIRDIDGKIYQTEMIEFYEKDENEIVLNPNLRSYYREGITDEKLYPEIYEIKWYELKKVQKIEEEYIYLGADILKSESGKIFQTEDGEFYISMKYFEIDGEKYINPKYNSIEIKKISSIEYVDSVYAAIEKEYTEYEDETDYTHDGPELICIRKAYYDLKFTDGTKMQCDYNNMSKEIITAFEKGILIFA